MSTAKLSDRRKALEDRFFQDQEAKKISRLRDELSAKKSREDLQEASGIEDPRLLDALVSLDVGSSDLAALALIPLVQTAWADGSMKDAERDAVLGAACGQGLDRKSHSYELLDAWLSNPPPADLYDAWTNYVAALREYMDEAQATSLKENILGLAHDVASAAGGILGIGSISAPEKAVLESISSAFD